jgi:UDP-N-acetylglucosamine--N-acetylmuramyl-(pentapeptide) pyrophosphoryl-undecaprenol N-acetylglucosamine transferase
LDGFEGSRIYFSPCGIGLGHVSRSVPIAQQVVKRGGSVLFSTYHEAVYYVQKYGLPVVAAPPIQLENDPTGSIDIKGTTIAAGITTIPAFIEQLRFEILYMKAFKPHVVFSDSRLSTIYAARLLKIPVVLLLNQFLPRIPRVEDTNFFRIIDGTVLTLLGRSWTLSNILVIPDFPEPYTISLDSLRIPRRYGARVNLVGSIIPKKPEDNHRSDEIRESLGVKEGQSLVYAGISGPKPEREPLIRVLVPIFKRFPDRYKVIMSMGVPRGGSKAVNHSALTLVPWMENRFEYLNACDMVISRGGHETIMQSICYRKPSIIIPVPKHPEQYGNARRAMELGVARAIHQSSLSKENLLKMVDEVANDGRYRGKLRDINSKKRLDMGLENTLEVIHDALVG